MGFCGGIMIHIDNGPNLSGELREKIRIIPGVRGWKRQDCRNNFETYAGILVNQGLAEDIIADFLSAAFWATATECGVTKSCDDD
jgi:hypothetical protein